MTQNCLLGHPNRVDEGTLSGGSWETTLPITNLQSKILGKVARTTNDSNTSTTFSNNLGAARKIDIVSLVNHNLSLDATWRVRASTETAATNLILRSEELDNASHTKADCTITANAVAAPSDAVTADKILEAATTAVHKVTQTVSKAASAITYTLSGFAKAAERTSIQVALQGSGSGSATVDFNLSAGTAGAVTVSGFTAGSATITASLNGYYRFTLTATSNTDTGIICSFTLLDSLGATSYLGVVTSGLYLWGLQLETGTSATSYYPTTTVAATRTAGYMDAWQSYFYDTGVLDVWPAVYLTDELEWEYDNFWLGQYTTEEIEGYTSYAIHIVPEVIIAQYWRVDMYDTTNTAGYVQVGRVFIGPAWQPTYSAEVGLGMGWETATQMQKALNGTRYYQRRVPFRVTTFSLNVMSVDEAMQNAFEIDRMAGIDKEIMFIQDPDDTLHALRRRYMGNLRQLSPIEYPTSNLLKKAYSIEEVV